MLFRDNLFFAVGVSSYGLGKGFRRFGRSLAIAYESFKPHIEYQQVPDHFTSYMSTQLHANLLIRSSRIGRYYRPGSSIDESQTPHSNILNQARGETNTTPCAVKRFLARYEGIGSL